MFLGSQEAGSPLNNLFRKLQNGMLPARVSPVQTLGRGHRLGSMWVVVPDIVQQRTSNMNSCAQFFPEVDRGSFPAMWIGSPELEEALGLPCPLVRGNQCAGHGPGLSSCPPPSSFAREGEQTPRGDEIRHMPWVLLPPRSGWRSPLHRAFKGLVRGQAWPQTQHPFPYWPHVFYLTPGTGDNASRSRRDALRAWGQWAEDRDRLSTEPPRRALTARTAGVAPGAEA